VGRRVGRTALALAALMLFAPAARGAPPAEDPIARAAAALMAAQLPSGLFQYDFDFLDGKPSGQDNQVRQAGTLFALGEYLLETGDPKAAASLRAGLDALAKRSLPIGRGRVQSALESLGLFAPPLGAGTLTRIYGRYGLLFTRAGEGRLVADQGDYAKAESGTTALGLAAAVAYFRATGDRRFDPIRRGWLLGLVALQLPQGGLRAVPTALDRSPFFEGEAWLALAGYHAVFPDDPDAARALHALEDYAIGFYGAAPSPSFYHWGALASALRYRANGDPRFVRFAAAQARSALESHDPEKLEGRNTCSLVEGLASAAGILQASGIEPELAARLRERVALELARSRPLQLRPGQERLEGGGGAVLQAPALARHAGAFLAGAHDAYTRTDYTQHCLSALIQARRAGLGSGASPDAAAR